MIKLEPLSLVLYLEEEWKTKYVTLFLSKYVWIFAESLEFHTKTTHTILTKNV